MLEAVARSPLVAEVLLVHPGELDLAGAFEFGETKARRLSTSYVVTGGELEFRETTAIVGGGKLRSQRGWLNFDVTPATYGFDLEAQKVDASRTFVSVCFRSETTTA